MTMPLAVIPYATTNEATSELQLRESDGEVRVIFGVHPMWIYALSIGVSAAASLLSMAVLLYTVRTTLWLLQTIPELRHIVLLGQLSVFTAAVVYAAGAIGHGYQLYRWGRVGRKITATPAGMTFTHMGWYAPRHRFVPANQVIRLELFRIENILSGPERLASLTIFRRDRWFGTRYRLVSNDEALATQIAKRLAAVLGCPLQIRGTAE